MRRTTWTSSSLELLMAQVRVMASRPVMLIQSSPDRSKHTGLEEAFPFPSSYNGLRCTLNVPIGSKALLPPGTPIF